MFIQETLKNAILLVMEKIVSMLKIKKNTNFLKSHLVAAKYA